MPKPNYQREKRLRDLARQQKQEEKRQKKAMKGQGGEEGAETSDAIAMDTAGDPGAEGDPAGE